MAEAKAKGTSILLNRVNNYAMVVKLSRDANATICGYLIEAHDAKGPNRDDALVTFGALIPSHDGEVRFMTIRRSQFDAITESDFWSAAEARILKYIEDAQLDALFYFPPGVSPATTAKFKKRALAGRYDVNIAIAHIYLLTEHARAQPRELVFSSYAWIRQDIDTLTTIIREVENTVERENLMRQIIIKVVPLKMIAIKVIPLTVNELRFIGDLRFRAWRENYVQEMCTLIRQGNVTNCFTWYWPWSLVHNIDDEFFENPFVIARFRRSEVVETVARGIESARAMEVADPLSAAPPAGADTRETPTILHAEFDAAMQHASGDISLSPTAVVFTSYMLSYPFVDNIPATVDELEQLIFGWFYGFLVMHEKIGAIHADAHVRNLHVRSTNISKDVIIGDMMRKMRFPLLGMIIDFSRAILNPYNAQVAARLTTSADLLAQRQAEYLANFVAQCFPGDSKLLRAAEALIARDFESAFIALSILDPIFALTAVRYELKDAAMLDLVDGLLAKCNAKLRALVVATEKCEEFPIRSIVLDSFGMVKLAKVDAEVMRERHVYKAIDPAHVSRHAPSFVLDDPENILERIKN